MGKVAKAVTPSNDFTKFHVDYWDGTWEVLTEKEITENPVMVGPDTTKEKTNAWSRGRLFERNRISAIIKIEIEYMESNPEGYSFAEIARYKRLLEMLNNNDEGTPD